MTVEKLIDELLKLDPESRVYYSGFGGGVKNEILSCRQTPDGSVVLADETGCNVGREIHSMIDRFVENDIEELDGYQEMADIGFTPDVVERYYKKEVADHMRRFCAEHGIDAGTEPAAEGCIKKPHLVISLELKDYGTKIVPVDNETAHKISAAANKNVAKHFALNAARKAISDGYGIVRWSGEPFAEVSDAYLAE